MSRPRPPARRARRPSRRADPAQLRGIVVLTSVGAAVLALWFAATATARPGPDAPGEAPPPGAPIVSAADEVAHELGKVGRTTYASAFAGVRVDKRHQRVILHVTDLARGRDLAAAVADRVGARVWARTEVRLRIAKYTRAKLMGAVTRLKSEISDLAGSGIEIHSVAVRTDGGGLVATSNLPELAAARTQTARAATTGPPVTFKRGPRVGDLSRYQDVPPYAGGIPLSAGRASLCSSAFGIARGSLTMLVSAEHCFLWSDLDVYTGTGARYIGRVSLISDRNDAAGIPTSTGSGVWVSNDRWSHYAGAAWSFAGQRVCQSGVTSNFNCGIRVNTSYLEWRGSNGIWHAGVEACSPSNAPAVRLGDSGGPVYVWMSDGRLQSRGLISGGRSTDSDSDLECVLFTETISLLNAWGASLLTR